VQFRTNNNLCRRCKLSLDSIEEVVAPEPVVAEAPACNGQLQIAMAIRTLRQRSGLSQRQLAMRMQVPRTYVSKIENDKATPTLSSLSRLADALGVSVPALLECSTNDGARSKQIEELLSDSFLAELAPFVSKLDAMQRSSFIAQVRDLATRPRRTA
jgi:transcriptional regulator with XRE-family HTH domain